MELNSDEASLEHLDPTEIAKMSLENIYTTVTPFKKVCIQKTIFYDSDFQTLLPGNWLNDKIINFYLELLKEYHKGVYYFNTFAYPMITKKTGKDLHSCFDDTDFSQYHTFFIPIHTQSHWSLVLMRDNLVLGFDSMGEVPFNIIAKIKDFYVDVILKQDSRHSGFYSRPMNGMIPKQTNGDDCGVFCCAYAKYYAVANPDYFRFDDCSIPHLRKQILYEILSGKILDNN